MAPPSQPGAINGRLGEVTTYLNRRSRRFTASLRVFRVAGGAALPPDELARQAFGPATVVRQVDLVSLTEALDAVEDALRWGGAPGAFPNPRSLTDPTWQALLETMLGELGELMAAAPALHVLGLGDGHPFDPVHWDVVLSFARDADGFVLVGAASD